MKEASQKTKVIVGGFIMGTVVLVSFILFFMGNNIGWLRGVVTYYTTFSSTDGLSVGAPLRMGGVEIGKVENINISLEGDRPKILVEIAVYKPNHTLIRVDSKISVRTQGMLGDKFLALITGSADSPQATPKTILPGEEGQGLFGAVNKTTEIIETIDSITKNVDTLVRELHKSDGISSLVSNASHAAQSLNDLTTRLNSRDSALAALTQENSAETLRVSLQSFKSSSTHLASVLQKIDEGQGTIGALVNDASLYDDMKKLIGRANRNQSVRYLIQKALETPDDKEEKKAPPQRDQK